MIRDGMTVRELVKCRATEGLSNSETALPCPV
jgi:hypothetical protein